jgi:PKD repeat protein
MVPATPQPGGAPPVPGQGPKKFLVPVVIAVVVIGIIVAVALVGIPGLTKPGTNTSTGNGANTGTTTTGGTAISRAFDGDWQVETAVSPGEIEMLRITIFPDNSVTASFPSWQSVKMTGVVTDGGSTLKGTYSDTASGEAGSFTLVLTDNNHFTGTWLIQGHSYTMTGQKGTQGSAPVTTAVPQTSSPVQVTAAASTISAGFSSDTTSGPVPLTVSFTDSSSGSPSTYYWDFGDGASSTTKNPVHTYTTAGTYTVKQTVGKNGQTSSKSQVISASSLPLTANFVADKTSGTAPLTVAFTDTSTGSPSTYIWQFGNGQVSYERNPEMIYQGPGDYTVQLTVEKAGVQNKKTLTIHVNPAQSVTNPVTIAAPVTTATSTATGSFVGYWTVSVGSSTEYYTFNMPVGNTIDGTFGGKDFSYATFTGTLSNGGTVVTGTYKDILNDVTGPFKFTLTGADQFSGTLVDSGVTYTVHGSREPI